MSGYYQVVGLKPGSEVIDGPDALTVDLSAALRRPLSKIDDEILDTRRKGEYIWVSGGGTYLLNDRYLPVVQRPERARVNPGKFSLFTGRADNKVELLNPNMLIRELFEELLLFTGKSLYIPCCREYKDIIGQVYAKVESDLGFNMAVAEPLYVKPLMCKPKMVTVKEHGVRWEGMLDYHISRNGEVNILFLLSAKVEIESLLAMDGEYRVADGTNVHDKRIIYLYDLYTAMGKNISKYGLTGESISIPQEAMTEHLGYIVKSVKRKVLLSRQMP